MGFIVSSSFRIQTTQLLVYSKRFIHKFNSLIFLAFQRKKDDDESKMAAVKRFFIQGTIWCNMREVAVIPFHNVKRHINKTRSKVTCHHWYGLRQLNCQLLIGPSSMKSQKNTFTLKKGTHWEDKNTQKFTPTNNHKLRSSIFCELQHRFNGKIGMPEIDSSE